ncbi:hypothetical protein HK098_003392 [Nowakowskiella sp. JEL0407]|nr:hypothetical protein HK098_003386 [Nowakowskiella sp. JEL0407]KAJ3128849.1 hypothetical protein HK098_003392 [Nowakowskiella sp. JEL0407]
MYESMRSEFANAWMYISAIIAGVISEHWSKRWVYRIVPVCPHLTLRPQQQQIPHGIKNILLYGQKSPSHKVFCDHSSHKLTNEEVDIGFLSRFWFTEQVIVNTNMDENLSSTNLLTGPQSGIEDGFGTIMLSYSWGKKDLMTGLYLNQEAVKKIASALETRGFKVWLDVCYMKGNMVTKMMNVIANCDAVISCVTNEYHIETSNSYREFMCAWYRKKKIFGIKLAKDADMAGGAYGFYKGYGDKFYSLADCDSEKAYELILDELARDISSTLEL